MQLTQSTNGKWLPNWFFIAMGTLLAGAFAVAILGEIFANTNLLRRVAQLL
jgi:hypothetical protein